MLVISGGRNDDNNVHAGFVDEIEILSLDTMTWLGVKVSGSLGSDRSLHNSVQVDSKLIIFGGSSIEYLSPDLLIIEFEPSRYKYLNQRFKKQVLLEVREIMELKEVP